MITPQTIHVDYGLDDAGNLTPTVTFVAVLQTENAPFKAGRLETKSETADDPLLADALQQLAGLLTADAVGVARGAVPA